ncbi:hypothetical protein PDESU_01937 [Pontiella desulfatans]|uniref:Uncharacterized protein n=1 Tax=Pontiella desulfatans TaxID=2750659 RepID=A0A6C2U0A3_PONDE|nr:hypothetical protein [Pontiella desulfatans]VGO13380.1 hypothetical protein PDESU_01937 [Pontiella desulfatans]
MKQKDDFSIWPPYQFFYIESMLARTEAALISAGWIDDFHNRMESGMWKIDQYEVLNHVQNIVHQAGALSRYFWPSKKYEGRGVELRRVFSVDETSPLKSRDVRNQAEHFDEKIDEYIKGHIAGNFFPSYVGPKPPNHGAPMLFFRAYYVDKRALEILGKQIELPALVKEIMRIHLLLAKSMDSGCVFPSEAGNTDFEEEES